MVSCSRIRDSPPSREKVCANSIALRSASVPGKRAEQAQRSPSAIGIPKSKEV
jgi:hypothetical protein